MTNKELEPFKKVFKDLVSRYGYNVTSSMLLSQPVYKGSSDGDIINPLMYKNSDNLYAPKLYVNCIGEVIPVISGQVVYYYDIDSGPPYKLQSYDIEAEANHGPTEDYTDSFLTPASAIIGLVEWEKKYKRKLP